MPFVVDASVVANWALRDEEHPLADVALRRIRTEEALTPALLWFETRNILVVSERSGRLAESDTREFLRNLALLPIRVDREPDEQTVLRLARAHSLSVYDATYLELALREALPLATFDRRLASAAEAEGVPLV